MKSPITPIFQKSKSPESPANTQPQTNITKILKPLQPKNAINKFPVSLCAYFSCSPQHPKCSPLRNPRKKRFQHNSKHQWLYKKTDSRQAAQEQFGRVKRRERPSIEARVPRPQQCRRMPRLHALANTTHRSFEATHPPRSSGQTPEKYDAKHVRTPP